MARLSRHGEFDARVFLLRVLELPVGSEKDDGLTFAVGGDAHGVTLEGLAYPLQNETLGKGRGRGVSNVLLAGEAGVRHERGVLLVIVTHLSQA